MREAPDVVGTVLPIAVDDVAPGNGVWMQPNCVRARISNTTQQACDFRFLYKPVPGQPGERYDYLVQAGQVTTFWLEAHWDPTRVSFINLSGPGGPTVRLEQYA